MIICITSSGKFFDTVPFIRDQLTLLGVKVYTPHLQYTTDPILLKRYIPEYFGYIRESDCMFVNDIGGYVGISVASEIGYAKALDKRIIFREKPIDYGIIPMASHIMDVPILLKFIQKILGK